jgi:peroxiredoxin
MGLRRNRYSMLVVDGVVQTLNVEGSGKFEVSRCRDNIEAGQRGARLNAILFR